MTRKSYPLEFKLDAVALARENGAQVAQVARDLGIAKTTLMNWVRKGEKDDIPGELRAVVLVSSPRSADPKITSQLGIHRTSRPTR